MSSSSMNEQPLMESKNKTPWHLYLVGSLFILIYLVGLYDYIKIHRNNLDYMNSLSAKGNVVEYFSNYPLLFTILWTINVFGGTLAGIMLLFKTKWVVWTSLAVVISKLSLDALTFLFRNRWDVFGPQVSLTDLTVLLISVGFYLYCRVMLKRGILI